MTQIRPVGNVVFLFIVTHLSKMSTSTGCCCAGAVQTRQSTSQRYPARTATMEEKHVPLGFPRGRAGGAEPSMRLESVASFASHDLPPHLSPGRGGSALPASHRPREAPVITFTLPSHGNESARSEASAEDSDGQGREVNRRQKKRRRPNGQNKVTPARNSIVFTDDVEKAVLRGRRLSSAHYTLPIHQMTRLTMSERREYYFRHPTARIFVAVSIIFLNLCVDPPACLHPLPLPPREHTGF